MKLFDVNGKLINVDIKPSSFPIKKYSKSALQQKVGEYLQNKYPHCSVLEEYPIAGTRMHVDFFIPQRKEIYEIDGEQHSSFNSHFHGSKLTSDKFAKQVSRDIVKEQWAEMNGFKLIRITDESELK